MGPAAAVDERMRARADAQLQFAASQGLRLSKERGKQPVGYALIHPPVLNTMHAVVSGSRGERERR